MKKIKNLKKRLGLISASVLMLLGGTAVSNNIYTNADTNSNTTTPNVIKIQKEAPNTNSKLKKAPKQQVVINQPIQQSNTNQSEEVTQQANELKNHIIQRILDQNNTNQNFSIKQVPQRQYQVVPNNEQQNVTVTEQEPQVNNTQQNIPNHTPVPVKCKHKDNSKIIDSKFKKDAQGLLDDLEVIANNSIDVQDTNLDSKMNSSHLESDPNNDSINSNK